MNPFRTQIKFFLENPGRLDLSDVAAVFQRWIQQKSLDGLLIDVADYRHVIEGPGIVLIGHESDYALENRDGRLGLLYTRKRQLQTDLQSQLRTSFRFALAACALLEAEISLQPRLKFRANEIEIRFPDRLKLPNNSASFDQVKADLQSVLAELYGADNIHYAPIQQDPRHLFTVEVRGEGVAGISDLIQHLQLSKQV